MRLMENIFSCSPSRKYALPGRTLLQEEQLLWPDLYACALRIFSGRQHRTLCFFVLSWCDRPIQRVSTALKYRFRQEKRNDEAFEDIYDGLEYQRLCLPGKFLEEWFNFSMTFNTDGCQILKSTKTSAWPVYAQINELLPHMRKKYVLLAAVYVGDKHPKMNNLLRSFTLQMKELFTNRITWNPTPTSEVTSRFVVLASTLDAPARAAVLRMKQYNGYFSCLRTDKKLKAAMKFVTKTLEIRNGVKGYSSLTALSLFSITKGVIVETMHSVFLGTVKLHTTILIKSTGAPYYIGNQETLDVINETLLSIKPPSRRSRKPRKIQSYAQWKALDWCNWLDYASICLSSVLDIKYVNHLSLLSKAIHYLNSDSLILAELNRTDTLLKEYAQLLEEYFGEVKMSSNIHSLSHVIEYETSTVELHNKFVVQKENKARSLSAEENQALFDAGYTPE
ncbi:Protein of unknown function [Cotesia congregata]|uniref:Uncharacterized protein n=1 Tax=Cotesia congregata TaxID=51543 RepID=A0A8J2HUF4_COTCN|nr:Protein of unknown function [Cotesia congregata]